MAPEIHIGEPYSREADLWSLGLYVYERRTFIYPILYPGCILFELCSMRHAFTGSNYSLVKNIVEGDIPSLDLESLVHHQTVSPFVSHLLVRDVHNRMKASEILEK